MVKKYLQTNLVEGFRESPFQTPLKAWSFVPFYALISFALGFSSGLLRFELVSAELAPLLLVTVTLSQSLYGCRSSFIGRRWLFGSCFSVAATSSWSSRLKNTSTRYRRWATTLFISIVARYASSCPATLSRYQVDFPYYTNIEHGKRARFCK